MALQCRECKKVYNVEPISDWDADTNPLHATFCPFCGHLGVQGDGEPNANAVVGEKA